MIPLQPAPYYESSYDTKERFCSYWHQIQEILSLKPRKVLEVGIGNGFVFNYLRGQGLSVTTLDINERLNPDLVGSVLSMPFPAQAFEVISCCEVLEHLPYKVFPRALNELHRVSSSYVVLSLPDAGKAYQVYMQIPKVGSFKKLIQLPRLRLPIHKFDGYHYWEIGKANYPLRRILTEIYDARFEIKKTYRVFEMPHHRFFILNKT